VGPADSPVQAHDRENGERIADLEPDIGYLHRCEEQTCQQSTYRHQIMPYPDRWDHVSAGVLNEWAYARAAEGMADLKVPGHAQVIRTMSAELCRIAAHMLVVGTFALDIYGDFTASSCAPSGTARPFRKPMTGSKHSSPPALPRRGGVETVRKHDGIGNFRTITRSS
jgi:hypothetical protein